MVKRLGWYDRGCSNKDSPQQRTFGGQAMLEVTEIAINSLKSYMTENNIDSPIRVALMQGG